MSSNASTPAVAKRGYTGCNDNCQDNKGCVTDVYFHNIWHANIPFVDPNNGQQMFYSTPWHAWHDDNARTALKDAGFTLGNPTGQSCDFQKQQNVGNTGGGTYLGTL